MKTTTILGLVLVALVGCGSRDQGGFDVSPPGDERGPVDAGGSGGSAGMAGTGGAAGAVGSAGGHVGAGGAGAGGSLASMGGAPGVGGASDGGNVSYLPCSAYSWSPSDGGGCTKQVTAGIFLTGYKDGHRCGVCSAPARPTGVPECDWAATSALCVLSCDECTFQ